MQASNARNIAGNLYNVVTVTSASTAKKSVIKTKAKFAVSVISLQLQARKILTHFMNLCVFGFF